MDLFGKKRKLKEKIDSRYSIALGYFYGGGMLAQNYELAVDSFEKAVALGSVDAINYLGICYRDGLGVNQDEEKAVQLFKEGYEKGDGVYSAYNLAGCYDKGIGTYCDPQKAIELLVIATENGNIDASNDLGVKYKDGDGVEVDYDKAFAYFSKAAEGESSVGIYNLADCHMHGYGTEESMIKAIEYWDKAGALGIVPALSNLGVVFEQGLGGMEIDNEKAITFYTAAALKGDMVATCNLANMHYYGTGMEVDKVGAFLLYTQAAAAGYADAQASVGYCYANGEGVIQDVETGRYWLEKAVANGSDRAAEFLVGYGED